MSQLPSLRMHNLVAIMLACSLNSASAQHNHNAGQMPYSGFATREIKPLSADDMAGLKSGRGMSLALSAELNGYPGPMHVLELEAPLKLTPAQRERTQAVMATMRQNAQVIGARIIDAERELDMRFARRHIDPETLATATDDIAKLQGELRRVHLAAHLEMMEILQPEQVTIYNGERGYGEAKPQTGHSAPHTRQH